MTPYSDADLERDLHAALASGDSDRITALAQLVDERESSSVPVPLASAALWYAEQGFRVFPLQPGRKAPFGKCRECKGSDCTGPDACGHDRCHGLKDATSDAARIRAWWDAEPDANLGLATGHLVDVIDIDGPAGVQSWARFIDELPPILGRVSTPRPGGNHLFVAAVPGRGNKAGILPGVDYRGTGGYVVAPPSRILAGGKDVPGTYRWDRPVDAAQLRAEVAA